MALNDRHLLNYVNMITITAFHGFCYLIHGLAELYFIATEVGLQSS